MTRTRARVNEGTDTTNLVQIEEECRRTISDYSKKARIRT